MVRTEPRKIAANLTKGGLPISTLTLGISVRSDDLGSYRWNTPASQTERLLLRPSIALSPWPHSRPFTIIGLLDCDQQLLARTGAIWMTAPPDSLGQLEVNGLVIAP